MLAVTGCGQQAPLATSAGTSAGDAGAGAAEEPRFARLAGGEPGPELTCPTDERVGMVADFIQGSKGAATPEKAVGLSSLKEGEHMVVGARGGTVWIVRADGTAREEIDLIRSKGWLLHMRESCV